MNNLVSDLNIDSKIIIQDVDAYDFEVVKVPL